MYDPKSKQSLSSIKMSVHGSQNFIANKIHPGAKNVTHQAAFMKSQHPNDLVDKQYEYKIPTIQSQGKIVMGGG
jgi:hypothetical protein